MAAIYNLHYDDITDGTDCPVDGSDCPNGGYTPAADRWNGGSKQTNTQIKIDDGDDLGGLHTYGSFTARNRAIVFDSGSSDNACQLSHNNIGTEAVFCDLFPLKISGNPSAITLIWEAQTSAAAKCGQVQVMTNGALRIRDGNQTAIETSTTTLSANTTYWISIKLTGNATTGRFELKIINGTTFQTIETIGDQVTNKNTGGLIDDRLIGIITGTAGANWKMSIGQIWSDDADHPTAPTASSLTESDLKWRLSTNTGSAGDSTAQNDPNDSLGKYMSTTDISATSLNNLWDDVSSSENSSLDVEYRCIFFYNSDTVESLYDVVVWIESTVTGSPTFAIALDGVGLTDHDSATAQSEEETDEGTAPTGETFSTPTTKGTGLTIGDMGPGKCQAIWIRRTAIDSAAVSAAGLTLRAEGGLTNQ